jgi:indolepyruvate ferredoxin oxidoreductase beta subunit
MMNQKQRATRVLIGTVGGQGGGVLSDWLVHGLLNAGWRATSIGLLGLSQRAGTVTYYCEAMPGSGKTPVSSMFATPGDVDLIIGQELLELARIVFGGFAAPGCAIVGNSARYLTTMEKMPAEGGVYDSQIIAAAVQALAPGRHYLFDAQRLVLEAGLPALTSNAMLLGAALASPAFDLPAAPFHEAIRKSEVNVKANIAAFDLGYQRVKDGSMPRLMVDGHKVLDWTELARQRAGRFTLARERASYEQLLAGAARQFPAPVLLVLAEALYRLIDFQDARYAEAYLEQLGALTARDGANEAMTAAYARNLGTWLTYEDAARVAQLKTRRERFERIAQDFEVGTTRFVVTDYLVPDTEQILGALPVSLARLVERIGSAVKPGFSDMKFPLRIKTSSVPGFWAMRTVAALRHLRRGSRRHADELRLIGRWQDAVTHWRGHGAPLALLAADAARVVKGYGRVRHQALDDLWAFLDQGMPMLAELGARGADVEAVGAKALTLLAKEAGSAPACLDYLARTSTEWPARASNQAVA